MVRKAHSLSDFLWLLCLWLHQKQIWHSECLWHRSSDNISLYLVSLRSSLEIVSWCNLRHLQMCFVLVERKVKAKEDTFQLALSHNCKKRRNNVFYLFFIFYLFELTSYLRYENFVSKLIFLWKFLTQLYIFSCISWEHLVFFEFPVDTTLTYKKRHTSLTEWVPKIGTKILDSVVICVWVMRYWFVLKYWLSPSQNPSAIWNF